MRVVSVNGKKCSFPENSDGRISVKAIEKVIGEKNRQIVIQNPNGRNVVVPNQGNVSIDPGAFITSLMLRRRGDE